jgi:hypothetical protein
VHPALDECVNYCLQVSLRARLCAGRANAVFYDGNELLGKCQDAYAVTQGWCLGFVAGVADTTRGACLPQDVILGQVRDVVVGYIWNNPQLRHYSASTLAGWALTQAFPCR